MKRIVTTLALLALLLAAAPAAAKQKTLYYDGETVAGEPLSFAIKGKRIFDVKGELMATCVPTHGTPLTYSIAFTPPGSFKLGKTRKATQTEYLPYKGDVRKYYTVSLKKRKGRLWIASLHVNFSYEEVVVGYGELEQHFYICRADDTFRFIV